MQRSNPELDNAFLSPDFALAAGRVRPATRVAVLEEAGAPAGFFAFEQGQFGIGGSIAPGVSDAQGVVHPLGFEWAAEELLRGCGLVTWEFDNLVESQLDRAGQHVVRRSSSLIDLSGGYAEYLNDGGKGSRGIVKSTLYKLRKLERDIGPITFEFESRDADALRLVMRWKAEQYRRTGRRDRFGVDWISALVWDLFGDPGVGTLSVLRAGDRIIAAHFGLRSSATLSTWFPVYDVELARYSPGLALHLRMAEAVAASGLRRLDMGKGDEEYKTWLRTNEVAVGEGWIARPSPVAMARRLQGAPARIAVNFVLSHPSLRRAARATLNRVGSVRRLL